MLRLPRLVRVTGICVALVCAAGTAGAAPAASDVALNVGAADSRDRPTLIPNGGKATVTSTRFYVFLDVSLISPTPNGVRARIELGGGLTWGPDAPDPSEQCTSTATTGECEALDLQPIAGGNSSGWFWDVVAPAAGTYTVTGAIVHTTDVDPDAANDTSQISVVVSEGTGGGGGGGGEGPAPAAKASSAKLSPARPTAGSRVVASVRVTRGGSPIRPARVTCVAAVGKVKIKGTPRSASGLASCLMKTPKSAKGKRLAGSLSFRAGGAAFTKRFAARLR